MRDQSKMLETEPANSGKMPEPRTLNLSLLPADQSERYYLERFMHEFGEKWNGTAIIEAPTGHKLSVSPLLFTNHKTGKTKINKEGRAPYTPYIAESIYRPDEVWLETGGHGDQTLHLLARYLIAGYAVAILAVFKERGRVWEGWSGYQTKNMVYVETKRTGTLLYQATNR